MQTALLCWHFSGICDLHFFFFCNVFLHLHFLCIYDFHFFVVFSTDNSSDSEKESLAQEIELGRSLEGNRHPNIVNFLGCVSASGEILVCLIACAACCGSM